MSHEPPESASIVYCEGAFDSTNGKTAHGLVRRSRRWRVAAVVDSLLAGRDAGEVLDGVTAGIPIVADLDAAMSVAGVRPSHLVIGLAPDGGRLPGEATADITKAIRLGLNVVCGLHDFLSEDPQLAALAAEHGISIHDVRKPPPRNQLHFFSGKINEVGCLKVALLGTDSAVGKRTTAWMLVDALVQAGLSAEMIGTGQTAWMQGARYAIVLDSLVNDFVAGEVEHAVWSAYKEQDPKIIVIEGQGSLLNPAYPGGFEILAAGRPDAVILQHAPARTAYDGFPDHSMHPLAQQIEAVRVISERPVIAITISHEGMGRAEAAAACERIRHDTGLPVVDPLFHGPEGLVEILEQWLCQPAFAVR